jgi:hypothetical protein
MFGMKKETQFHLRENGSGGRGGGGRGGGGRGVGGGGAGKDLLDFRADSLEFFNTKQARIWKHTPIPTFTVCTYSIQGQENGVKLKPERRQGRAD